jgi:PH domain/LIM domain/Calponin homology (CH) domain
VFQVKQGNSDADMLHNNALAFRVAEELGVPALLDAEDMLISKPEQFSVITYLSQFYHHFTKMAQQGNAAGGASRPGAGLASISQSSGGGESKPAPKKPAAPAPTSTAEKCSKCGEDLEGAVLEVLGKLWHQHCFCCSTCGERLASKCLNVQGKPYCEPCGRKAFSASRNSQKGPQPKPPAKPKAVAGAPPPAKPAPKKGDAPPAKAAPKDDGAPSRPTPKVAPKLPEKGGDAPPKRPAPKVQGGAAPPKRPAPKVQHDDAPPKRPAPKVNQTSDDAPPKRPAPKVTQTDDAPPKRSAPKVSQAADDDAPPRRSPPKVAEKDEAPPKRAAPKVLPTRPSKDTRKSDSEDDDDAPPAKAAPQLPSKPSLPPKTGDEPDHSDAPGLRTKAERDDSALKAIEDATERKEAEDRASAAASEDLEGSDEDSLDDLQDSGPPKRAAPKPSAKPTPKAPPKPAHLGEDDDETSDDEQEPEVAQVSVRQSTALAAPVGAPAQQQQQALPNLAAYLEKRGDVGVIKTWKRRWCVLRRDRLVYYESDKSTEPFGHIPLTGLLPSAVQLIPADKKPGGFQITTEGPRRNWVLRAPNDDERDQWMAAVLKHAQFSDSGEDVAIMDGAAGGHGTLNAQAELLPDLNFERKEGFMEKLHTGAAVGAFGGKMGKKLAGASWTSSMRKKLKWNKRYFVLKDGILFKYDSKEKAADPEAKPTKIALYGCEMEEYVDPAALAAAQAEGIDIAQVPGYGRQFSITNKRVNVILRLDSEEDMQRWLNAILQHKILIQSVVDSVVI